MSPVPPYFLRTLSEPVHRIHRSLMAALVLVAMPHAALAAEASVDGELVPPGEASDTALIVESITSSVKKDFEKSGHAVRDAHRKSHGCVTGKFTVLDNLPPQLAQGLFSIPRSYQAVIRFSNGSGQSRDDRVGDARGMALKLMGVPGETLMDDDASRQTQDFVMMSHPVFFIRKASDYVGFQQAMDGSGLQTFGWFLGHLFHETRIILAIRNNDASNPLNARYWSTTPSKLGTEQMKFSAKPCVGSTFAPPLDTPNRLRESLKEHLASKPACFDFMVQTRTAPDRMPIEDPTVEWKEEDAPFVKVAQIDIGPQESEIGEACDGRSFNPWHAIESHRPLGGISRVRREVYLAVSALRHKLNGASEKESGK